MNRTAPRIATYYEGAPVLPALVGNTYQVASGLWVATRHVTFSTEWLSGGRLASRAKLFQVPATAAGRVLAARLCAVASVAVSCATIRLPGPVQSVAQFLQASCATRMPPAPAYNPDFAFFSAPAIGGGWNPCRPVTWAIDDYAEPALIAAPGVSWDTLATQAIAQVSAATGIAFLRAPNFAAPAIPGTAVAAPGGVALTIAFAPQGPDIGGTGGPSASAGQFTTHAQTEIDTQTAWRESSALVTLLHELGHAMGLNHPVAEPPAPDPHSEIMDPSGPDPFTTYQAGDLCGLFELTWQQPCAGAPGLALGQGQISDASALALAR